MKIKKIKLQAFLIFTNLSQLQTKKKTVVKPSFRKNRAVKAKMKIIRKMKTMVPTINTIKDLELIV